MAVLAGARADPALCAAEREAPLPTPLLMAVDRGHVEAVKMLLQPAAQVPKLLRVPYTPRAAAVEVDVGATGDAQKSAGAAGAGADPDKGAPGSGLAQSPLLLAVARGHSAVARALLDAGAACNILVATGRRPEDAQRPQTRMVGTLGSLPLRWYHHLLLTPVPHCGAGCGDVGGRGPAAARLRHAEGTNNLRAVRPGGYSTG